MHYLITAFLKSRQYYITSWSIRNCIGERCSMANLSTLRSSPCVTVSDPAPSPPPGLIITWPGLAVFTGLTPSTAVTVGGGNRYWVCSGYFWSAFPLVVTAFHCCLFYLYLKHFYFSSIRSSLFPISVVRVILLIDRWLPVVLACMPASACRLSSSASFN